MRLIMVGTAETADMGYCAEYKEKRAEYKGSSLSSEKCSLIPTRRVQNVNRWKVE